MAKKIKTVNCEFLYKCPQIWEDLTETNQKDIRFCRTCESNVYFTQSESKLEKLRNEGKCVAVLKEDTESNDYTPENTEFLLGIPSAPLRTEEDVAKTNQESIRQITEEKILIEISLKDLRPNVPGYVLNDCEPGSDGAVYFIERNPSDKFYWDLYKCCEVKTNSGIFVEVEKAGEKLEIEKLYKELEQVNIYLLGHEAIALGLPYHIDPYGID